MKKLQLITFILTVTLSTAMAVEVTPVGPNTSDSESKRIQEDYLQVRKHAIREFLETGTVGPNSYRSLSMQVSFAQARGYRIEPALRLTGRESIGTALIMQLLEEDPRNFDYISIYDINLDAKKQ